MDHSHSGPISDSLPYILDEMRQRGKLREPHEPTGEDTFIRETPSAMEMVDQLAKNLAEGSGIAERLMDIVNGPESYGCDSDGPFPSSLNGKLDLLVRRSAKMNFALAMLSKRLSSGGAEKP